MPGRQQVSEPLVRGRGLFAALSQVTDGLVAIRSDGVITFASPAVQSLVGWDPTDLVGRNILDYFPPEDAEAMTSGINYLAGRDGAFDGGPMQVRTPTGTATIHYSTVTGEAISDLGDVVIVIRPEEGADPDQVEQLESRVNEERLVKLASAFLSADAEEFQAGLSTALSTIAGVGLLTRLSVWQADGDVVRRRAIWESRTGAPAGPLPGSIPSSAVPSLRQLSEAHLRTPDEIVAAATSERGQQMVESGVREVLAVPMARAGRFEGFVMAEHTYEGWYFNANHFSTMRSAAALFAEAFARNDAEREVVERASIDVLTGLPNRWAFEDLLDDALAAFGAGMSPGLSVAVIGIDRFKNVNDALGHQAGDAVLRDLSERLQTSAAAEGDGVTVARLGGDVFLVLDPRCGGARQATALLGRVLRRALDPPFHVGGRPIALTASAGAIYSGDGKADAPELLRLAELAMYRAKRLGGNRLESDDPVSRVRASERLRMEHELRSAIGTGSLFPYLQGEWDLATGRIVGAEALARWQHPDDGLLQASDFIPVAEESDLVVDVDDEIISACCKVIGHWRRDGFAAPFLLRVNISARQLRRGGLLERLSEIVQQSAVSPSELCLELTESALLVDPAQAVDTLTSLRELGFGLAIDDFGTGYSSLLYLRNLPLTSIKIDRLFVSGILTSRADRAIVASVVQLAERLGVTVTAEGCDSDELAAALVELGCRRAQGFSLSVPEPVEEFSRRLAGV